MFCEHAGCHDQPGKPSQDNQWRNPPEAPQGRPIDRDLAVQDHPFFIPGRIKSGPGHHLAATFVREL
jgi:hypothetical protein